MPENIQYSEITNLSETDYLRTFPGVDVNLVGDSLGRGMGHIVYEYGLKEVVKVPLRRSFHKPPEASLKEWELGVVNSFFPGNAVATEVLKSNDHPYYLLIQERLNKFENISPDNIGEVGTDIGDIITENRELLRTQGVSLDFLGKEGMTRCVQAEVSRRIKPEISNLVISKDHGIPHIAIPDFSILRLREGSYPSTLQGKQSRLIATVTFALNRRLINRHFGVEIGARDSG